ncbi:MAG: type IV toxin-antitoxin system AbiEi family antitoxin domain-containing protein [Actinobacteria bacterium]|nr:type IV toxin-antitoxin system AbiEi family antitoxin domain-containing protein [Actinomycetota bacterium]
MPAWHAAVDRWFGAHHGIASVLDLVRLGMSEATVYRLVRDGRLERMMPGVVRSLQFPDTDMQRYAAACARNPAALVAFTSAGRLWGFRKVPDLGRYILVPHGVSPELPGVVVRRCRRIDSVDVVERPDGIRLTSPPRTLFDSADMLGVARTRSVMEQVLHEQMCTLGTVTDTVARLAHPNRPGTRTMMAVIASRPAWRTALHSDLEMRVLDEIERQRLPAPITQCPVLLPNGVTIHLDFGWPEWRVGMEVDHPAWHAGVEEHHRDTTRDRKAGTIGWLVPRLSQIAVETGLGEAISDVAIILGQRRAG